MNLTVLRSQIVLLIIAAYLILNAGFMLVRFPPGGGFGVPVAELLVLAFLLTLVFDLRRLQGFALVAPLTPLLVWWTLGALQAMRGVELHGIWALRDASHLVDSFFLWIAFVIAASPHFFERFSWWLRAVLNLGVVYALLFPFKDALTAWSPKISAPAGYSAPLFFNYVSTSLVPLTAALAWLVDRVRFLALPATILAGALIVYSIVIFQARITYLQVMIVLAVFAFLRPRDAARISIALLVSGLLLAVVLATGVEITGRLGEKFSIDFLFEHFASIWGQYGQGNVSSAADGVGLRLRWWARIWNDLTSSVGSFLFGLGYGIPLTDLHTPDGAIVREPHNSLISLAARQGFVGLAAFLWVQIALIASWFRVYRHFEREGNTVWRNNLLIMGTFFVLLAVLALGQDGFEKPFNAVPYYFFWGVILRAEFQIRAQAKSLAGRAAMPSNATAGYAAVQRTGPEAT